MYKTLFSLLSLSISSVFAQWQGVNPMNSVRTAHVSVVLDNTKLLVAGGYDLSNQLKSAEVFDFLSGTWTNTQTLMSSEHTTGAACLLNDGSVLVSGGYNGSLNLDVCEKYVPSTDTWSAVASLNAARSEHSLTKLQDGKILAVGGYNGTVNLASCELYDPANNTWTNAASLSTGRSAHTATLLNDGRVLAAGGFNPDAGFQVITTEIYDPVNDSWTTGPNMAFGRNQHAASLLSNGKVLISGGEFFTGQNPFAYEGLTSAEIFDPSNNTFSAAAPLPVGLSFHKQIAYGNYVMAVAGLVNTDYLDGNFTSVAGVTYSYNITADTWTAEPMNLDGRHSFTANLVGNKILVCGGQSDDVEMYNTQLGLESIPESAFSVFPNPAKTQLNISLKKQSGEFGMKIKDLSGRILLDLPAQKNPLQTIDISGFSNGMYVLDLELNGETSQVKFGKN